jgi:type IV secretory pathway VirD2 relaxase
MAKQNDERSSEKLTGKVEPDRVGRMHARRRELSVRGQLARRLAGFRGRTRPAASAGSGSARMQRVVVKTHVSRHRPGKVRGSLTRHASYLGRDSASADGQPGVFYDAARDEVDAKRETAAWVEDRHHFRVIISAERGEDIPSLTAYVREIMGRMEKDLDTRLTWVGINHHNTDNPHSHVVIRGRKADGTDLVIPREYLSSGMRKRASEVATDLLGERTVEQVREARRMEVTAERFTSLDRIIERHAVNGRIDVAPSQRIGYGSEDRTLVLGRLQFLETLGLAGKNRGTTWGVEPEFGRALRELGQRHDLIKQLYSTLGNEAGRVQRMGASAESAVPVMGVVIAKGNADEVSDDRFIVVRDARSQTHYGVVAEGDDYRSVRLGSVAELGTGNQRRREMTAEIIAVAQANGGVYSSEAHLKHLRSAQPERTEAQLSSRVRSAEGRLAFVAGHAGSGVRGAGDGTFAVDGEAFDRFSRRGMQRVDVRPLSHQTLTEQTEARAFTWLDRQVFGSTDPRLLASEGIHSAVAEAGQRRAEWLIAHGYAERSGTGQGGVQLRRGAIRRLAGDEREAADRKLAERHGLPVVELPQGGAVTGNYQGVETLHSGKRAVVITDENVFVAPVRRVPRLGAGVMASLSRTGSRDASVQPVTGAAKGSGAPGVGAPGAQMYLDGLEAGR